jgi:hypothetical protein
MKYLLLFVSSLFLAASSLFAADLLKSDVPVWVNETAIPAVDEELVPFTEGGIYYLLSDEQVRWEGVRRFSHMRLVTKVLRRAGLERAATLLRDFDPQSETLTVTRIDILRGSERISLRDKLEAQVLRREEGLESGMIDGTLTAHFEVPDLRVGDVLDVSFLWASDPVFDGQTFSGYFDHEFSVPLGLARLVLNWPENRHLQLGPSLEGLDKTDSTSAGVRRIELRQTGHEPLDPEDDLPPEHDPWHSVLYSAAKDWAEVASPLSSHYDQTSPVPASWLPDVDAIRSQYSDLSQRAFAALRLVQNKVRYVGVEVGKGGYFARDPALVVSQGFGDCKDKAVLLVTVLRALGIEADVALADLDRGYGLGSHIPSPSAFNHMIVRTVLNGQPVWMDPTGSYEGGGIGTAATPSYGFALPVTGKAAGQMQPIIPQRGGIDRIATHETIIFKDNVAEINVDTDATGAAADWLRWQWETTPHRDMERDYLDYYEGYYPGIETRAPIRLTDDEVTNRLLIHEFYTIPAEALADEDLFTEFPFFAAGFGSLLPEAPHRPRRAPIYIGLMRERLQEIVVKNAPITFTVPEAATVRDSAFQFHYSGQSDEVGGMTLRWYLKTTDRIVAPERAADYGAARKKFEDAVYWSWDLTSDGPEPDGK